MKNAAISARYARMLGALDLAIDWMATKPVLYDKEGKARKFNWTNALTEAADEMGCSEVECMTLINESSSMMEAGIPLWTTEDGKLQSLILLREKYVE